MPSISLSIGRGKCSQVQGFLLKAGFRAIFGAMLIFLIWNLMNISSYMQMVVTGCLLIFAVVMDQSRLSIKGR